MSDITVKKQKEWLFKKGQSGNPNGRPKGSFSIKTRIIQRLEDNPKQLERLIDYLINNQQGLIFQMIDGRPPQATHHDTSKNYLDAFEEFYEANHSGENSVLWTYLRKQSDKDIDKS